jgi:cell division transport system permease protein
MSIKPRRATDPFGSGVAGGPQGTGDRFGRWLRDHRRIAADSLIFVSQRLGTSVLVWLLIGISLALPGGLFLLQTNLALMSERWEGRPGMTVYMRVDADPSIAPALRDELAGDRSVERVALISADAALGEFQKFTGVSDALAQLDRNPLPSSLRIVMKANSTPAQFDDMATRLRARAGVDEVAVERTWLERVQAITDVVKRLGIVLAVLFGGAAILVTATSVRLAIESRLEELRVMKLVGATHGYMRRPFLYFGLFYGLGGGIAGAMLISGVLGLLEKPLTHLLGSYGQTLAPAGLGWSFFLTLIVSGGMLGVVGALVAARARIARLQIV